MSRLVGSISCNAVALAAATAKTVLQLKAPSANHRIALLSFSVSFDGASGSAVPVLAQLVLQQDDQVANATAVTPVGMVPFTETLQAAGYKNYTVEPATVGILRQWYIHPQTGLSIPFSPDLDEIQAGYISAGDHIGCVGLVLKAPAIVNATAEMVYEE